MRKGRCVGAAEKPEVVGASGALALPVLQAVSTC